MEKVRSKKMKLAGMVVMAAVLTGMLSCQKEANENPLSQEQTYGSTERGDGNGAPNGPHYDLNIIGVPQGKTADMTGNHGHRIFVSLQGNTKIYLRSGEFQVLDANGTDANGAKFQLPNPDSLNSGTTTYSVYARALGAPGGSSVIHLCGVDATGNTFCSGDSVLSVRSKGQQQFTNVSKDMLYLFVDLDGDGNLERVPLFDQVFQDYFWNYDNDGLKLLQLRFYQNQ